ncbi:helix-turn-helix transcriptional regulator [Herbiconiux sp. CPCC 205763]|uniref:Helix-turn-helix transcriptional regulator n=1 Tax=Herbiconiux aconitum TaxID=2970913 RepID=A0ABT2GNW4_9MICO|nr:helix-turn-helix domain-containing protein [Herbiconiux aconitum]MCS5717920.1 helix-turn-helix transcriptional regulator [Herbiconiux aconitum]
MGQLKDAQAGADSEARCQIVRTLDIVGEKWSLLIVRDAFRGNSRFSEFRDSLGAPSDILTARLAKLVEAGVLEKRAYREPGSRERSSYHLTESGQGLALVIGALVQWGDEYNPYPGGASSRLVGAQDREPVTLAFVSPSGEALGPDEVAFVPGPAARVAW